MFTAAVARGDICLLVSFKSLKKRANKKLAEVDVSD